MATPGLGNDREGTGMSVTLRRVPRCKHYHLSGRRCAESTSHESKLCSLHRNTRGNFKVGCAECDSMRLSFVPPKGW